MILTLCFLNLYNCIASTSTTFEKCSAWRHDNQQNNTKLKGTQHSPVSKTTHRIKTPSLKIANATLSITLSKNVIIAKFRNLAHYAVAMRSVITLNDIMITVMVPFVYHKG
jgi:hypothetical protein